MLSEYIPIGLLLIVAFLFAFSVLIFSALTSQKSKSNPAKDSAYECGVQPLTGPQTRFSVKFYLTAMLFILFDIEVVFLYPWAVVYKELVKDHPAAFFAMFTFLGILFLGFLYALKKGALDWNRR